MKSNPTSSALVDLRALSALDPSRRVDALVSRADAEAAVQSLEPFGLYHLVREVGLNDCAELCLLTSDEQTQALIDLDCWRRDEVDGAALLPWIRLFLEGSDARLIRMLTTSDPEPLVLLFKESLVVFHLEDGVPPPEIESQGIPWETLDGVWAFSFITEDDDTKQLIRQLLRRWYHFDIQRARATLEAVSWELTANLTDTAYRMRSARLAEMGFVPFDEAAGMYARVDLNALREKIIARTAGERAEAAPFLSDAPLPDLFRERFHGDTFLESCISAATDLPENLGQQMVAVANKALAAEPADPRDLEAARQSFDRVRGLLDIGLEFLAGGDVTLGADILSGGTHLQEIAQAGHNVVLGVADQARRVFAGPEMRGALTIVAEIKYSMLEPSDRGLVTGLLAPRPLYHPRDASYPRPFEAAKDIRDAANRLTMLAFEVTALYGWLGVTPQILHATLFRDGVHPPAESITLGTLLRTIVALWALGDPGPLRALSVAELATIVPVKAEMIESVGAARLEASELGAEGKAIGGVWLKRVAATLADELGGLQPGALQSGDVTPEMLGATLLLSD